MDDIKQQTSSTARAVGETIGHKAEEVADRSREAGAEGVARAARTAGAVADAVAADVPAVAEYVRGAAQKIERLAGDLRESAAPPRRSSGWRATCGRRRLVSCCPRRQILADRNPWRCWLARPWSDSRCRASSRRGSLHPLRPRSPPPTTSR